ncbi:hypothetical protein RI138_31825 [Streptomyces sp. C11-1]|uniref:Uncharacterized protein n=1 Tax=Streptomyces durocortorensis TaxID=2811104 RepID=A0ABY9W7L0_9ACTN|nr:hypothetical protein [Streptomyces durocortorensis]WNF31056.1 hypothetical protein RI138_31825 [Streptomyces durocortorensis]
MSEFELLDRKERALRAETEVLDKEIAEIRQRRDAVEATLQRIADARATLEQLLADDPAPCSEPEEDRVEPGADDAGPDGGMAGGEEADTEASATGWDRSTPGPVDMEEARRRAVTLLATSGRKMRARAIAEAIGEDVSTAARVETTRGRLKTLVTEGALMEDPAGVFFIATSGPPAEDAPAPEDAS